MEAHWAEAHLCSYSEWRMQGFSCLLCPTRRCEWGLLTPRTKRPLLSLCFLSWCNRVAGCWVGRHLGDYPVQPPIASASPQPLTHFLIITCPGSGELSLAFPNHPGVWRALTYWFLPLQCACFSPGLWLLNLNFTFPKSKVQSHYAESSQTSVKDTDVTQACLLPFPQTHTPETCKVSTVFLTNLPLRNFFWLNDSWRRADRGRPGPQLGQRVGRQLPGASLLCHLTIVGLCWSRPSWTTFLSL